MRILIIDDEKNIIELLSTYIQRSTDGYAAIETAQSVAIGLDKIRQFEPEVVFLDIQLGNLTGFDLLDQLSTLHFHLIFVTAYNEHAIKAFEYAALHYLVKPVSEDQIRQCLERCKQQPPSIQERLEKAKKLIIKTTESDYVLDPKDVAYFEADGAYCAVHLMNGKKIMTSKNLGEYEKLMGVRFYRVHHSLLVNIGFVLRLDNKKNLLFLKNGTVLPISRRKKKGFRENLES